MKDPLNKSTEDWLNETEKFVKNYNDRIKYKLGGHATFIWIIFGIILHFYYGKSLFTLYSLGYFVIGMFLAAIIIGAINYVLLKLFYPRYAMKLMVIQNIIPFIFTWLGFRLLYQ